MVKKIIAWMLIIATTAAITVGGTLAYLTDRDSEANVFTTGDVKIDLEEDFQQGAELLPGVEVEKKPTITNIGENEAYVWATVAIPGGLDEVVTFLNQNTTDWDWTSVAKVEKVEINGVEYTVLTALYNNIMAQDAETPALFEGVALDDSVDIDPDGQWHTVVNGTAADLEWNNSDGNPVIYVSAYAIQAEGFVSVKAAYDAYQTQWGDKGGENGEVPYLIYNYDELVDKRGMNGNWTFGDDIYGESYVYFGDNTDVTVNMNGYDYEATGTYAFVSQGADCTLTFKGEGTISCENSNYSLYVSSGGKMVIDGVNFNFGETSSNQHCFVQNNSLLVINDGTFISEDESAAILYCINGFIEINGGFFQNTTNPKAALLSMGNNLSYINNQKITISGGTFVNWNPMDSAFARPWTNPDVPALIVLAEGCEVISETQANGDIWYTVVKK